MSEIDGVPNEIIDDLTFEIREQADHISWADTETAQEYYRVADYLSGLKE